MFGGFAGSSYFNDTWEWNGTAWSQRAPANAPSARYDAGLAYDTGLQRVLLYGGFGPGAAATDTWSFDGNNWQQLTTVGPSTTPWLAHDPRRQRTVLVDAQPAGGGATYEWNGGAWVQRLASGGQGGLVYDPVQRGLLAVGDNIASPMRRYLPIDPAAADPYGAGCAGPLGVPQLAAVELPWLAGTLRLQVTGVPAGQPVLLALGNSRTAWGAVPLPLALDPIGMLGCALLASFDAAELVAASSGVANWQLAVPNLPTLVGAEVFGQAAVGAVGTNPFGWVATGGLALRVGAR